MYVSGYIYLHLYLVRCNLTDILLDEKVEITNNDEAVSSTHKVLLWNREIRKLINYFFLFIYIILKLNLIGLVFTLINNN